ncbi:MAG: MmcQ/YjbR family DNA-binding protein [Candidatus Eremiobacteraeota bacterium]|nr:MmcQ/YjbR family DNA-binding protein [Candidatus Eremiobacteraeota bacterium]
MATWRDVRRLAMSFPATKEIESRDHAAWTVGDRFFVWERPLRRSDLVALGDEAPSGPILGVRTADLEMKEVLLASNPRVYFTIPHFDGYAAVLIRLSKIGVRELKNVMTEAWLARAPKRAADAFLAGRKRK